MLNLSKHASCSDIHNDFERVRNRSLSPNGQYVTFLSPIFSTVKFGVKKINYEIVKTFTGCGGIKCFRQSNLFLAIYVCRVIFASFHQGKEGSIKAVITRLRFVRRSLPATAQAFAETSGEAGSNRGNLIFLPDHPEPVEGCTFSDIHLISVKKITR